MQYAVLLYDDERKWQDMSPDAAETLMAQHMAFGAKVSELGGSITAGQQLTPTVTATTLHWAGDDVTITEGPYAETAEQLGGFYVIDLPDLDAAIEAVKVLPHQMELRPVVVHDFASDGSAPPDVAGDLYVVLLYGDEERWLRATPEERDTMYAMHGRFAAGAPDFGTSIAGGEELAHSSTATTLRQADGTFTLSDGPFAETAEQLTGFYVVRAPEVTHVVKLLDLLPAEVTEIRPTIEHSDPAG